MWSARPRTAARALVVVLAAMCIAPTWSALPLGSTRRRVPQIRGGAIQPSSPPPSNPPPRKKTPLRTLKQLLQELEESDYGSSFGTWGSFEAEEGALDSEVTGAHGQPRRHAQRQEERRPSASARHGDGLWSDPETAERDIAAATGRAESSFGRQLAPATAAVVRAAVPPRRRRASSTPKLDDGAEDGGEDLAGWRPGVGRALLAVPPDEAEDLTLREPREVDGAVVAAEALRTAYRCCALAALGMALAAAAACPMPGSGTSTTAGGLGPALAGIAATLGTRTFRTKFHQNLALLLATAAPSLLFGSVVFDRTIMTVHDAVKVAFGAATWGFALAYALEVAAATVLRLAVYRALEPQLVAAALGSGVAPAALPWLGGAFLPGGERVGPVAAFVAELLLDCVAAPFVEEAVKLAALRRALVLPQGAGSPLARHTSVHAYLGYMLAAGGGLKLADNARRVALYTRPEQLQKTFFAFARGVFPVHELCSAITAMELVKSDVLGKPMPAWKMVLPAAFLHGMANFRGKKPLFKWGSSAPWVEMQLQAWSTADDAPAGRVIANGVLGLFWLSALAKALVSLCKRYYELAKEQRRDLRLRRYSSWQRHAGTTDAKAGAEVEAALADSSASPAPGDRKHSPKRA